MPTANTNCQQIIEAVVAGPDEANKLFTITGTANVGIFVSNQGTSDRSARVR